MSLIKKIKQQNSMLENSSRTFKVTILVLFIVVLGVVVAVILNQKGLLGKMSAPQANTTTTKATMNANSGEGTQVATPSDNPAPKAPGDAPYVAPSPSTPPPPLNRAPVLPPVLPPTGSFNPANDPAKTPAPTPPTPTTAPTTAPNTEKSAPAKQ